MHQLKNSSDTANVTSLEFIGIIASRVFYMSLGMGLSINGHHNYCGDYIFSGHTVILVLSMCCRILCSPPPLPTFLTCLHPSSLSVFSRIPAADANSKPAVADAAGAAVGDDFLQHRLCCDCSRSLLYRYYHRVLCDHKNLLDLSHAVHL